MTVNSLLKREGWVEAVPLGLGDGAKPDSRTV
jgi:hypothetical protein